MSENTPPSRAIFNPDSKKSYLVPLYFKKNKDKDKFFTQKVCEKVALLYDLNTDLIVRGTDPISRKARKLCYYILKKKKGFALRYISILFGRNYEGSAVHTSIKEITNFLANEGPEHQAEIRNINKLIQSLN